MNIEPDIEVLEQDKSWVLFDLNRQQYGVRTKYVEEMVILGDVVETPDRADYMRGVLNLRGKVIPIIDLRKRFGMPGIYDEVDGIANILAERKQDHINWLEELKRSVEENREFALQTDPHKCGFGKWYDSFETTNNILRLQLKKFNTPHQRIHGIAKGVRALVAEGKQDEALARIEAVWNGDLAKMIHLFDDTQNFVRRNTREIVLVILREGNRVGLVVDGVSEVSDISEDVVETSGYSLQMAARRFIFGLAKLESGVKILVDLDRLLDD